MLKLPTIEFGDATPAIAAWKNGIEWIRGIKGDGTALVKNEETQITIGSVLPVEKDFLLAGSTSPYSGSEVYPISGGGWTAYPSGSTYTGLYEFNGVSGLSGKVVHAELTRGDEWRFRYNRSGSSGVTACAGCSTVPTTIYLHHTTGTPYTVALVYGAYSGYPSFLCGGSPIPSSLWYGSGGSLWPGRDLLFYCTGSAPQFTLSALEPGVVCTVIGSITKNSCSPFDWSSGGYTVDTNP